MLLWANNQDNEGFVEEILDRFFASPDWLLEFDTAIVLHEEKQSSDHSFLILDSKPPCTRYKSRFYFDGRSLDKSETMLAIEKAWSKP